MTVEELKVRVPAAFTQAPAPTVSDRYRFFSTIEAVTALTELGWQIMSARQRGSGLWAPHQVTLAVTGETQLRPREVGEVTPTATIWNAHDGSHRLVLTIGLFRCVCSNQMHTPIVAHRLVRRHVRQRWQDPELDTTTLLNEVREGFGRVSEVVGAAQRRILTPAELVTFGREAIAIRRYGEPRFAPAVSFTPEVLEVRRTADEGNDLWRVFNRVQENITQGLMGVERTRSVNMALWNNMQRWLGEN